MSPTRIEIHPDIRQASTLPSRVYSDPTIYAEILEKIFARSWQMASPAALVRIPGEAHPVTLLEGSLDEPLLFTRDQSDQLHCLSNVCTHRGNLLVEHGGVERVLTCRYHGRKFDLDGRFRSMPEFEQCQGFPTDADHLPRVPFAAWGPLLFAALNLPHPFEEHIAPVHARVGHLPLNRMEFDPSRSRDYLVNANWALYCDNYLEGFHIPFVHAALNEALDYGSYRTELFPHASVQVGVAREGESAFSLPAGHPDHGTTVAAWYFWLFPNIMLNFYPWGLSVNIVKPLGPTRTRVSYLTFVSDPSQLDQGAGAGLDRVEREDEAIVEAVQRGTRSRFYDRGRYSPTREQGVHHFHRLLATALG